MKNFNDIVKQTDNIVKIFNSRWLKNAWKNEKEISQVLDLLSDDESKENYSREIMWCFLNTFLKGQLAARMAGMMSVEEWKRHVEMMYKKNIHPEIEAPASARGTLDYSKTATFILDQYRFKDKVTVNKGDICLDLGACLGDTAVWMLEQGASEVHAFEIEPLNREYLGRTLAKDSRYSHIKVVPKAVSNKNESLYMIHNSYNSGAGCLTAKKPPSGNFSEIECVTIDKYCETVGIIPDFLKMDIEGSELDAINGAVNIFEKHRPKFAICIYHKWEHRWEIPLRLAQLCPDYSFYVKKSHPVFETVFYGCPMEKLGSGRQH